MHHYFHPENGNTVRRRLRLAAPVETAICTERLGALDGVKWIALKGTDLTVAYDFTQIDYDTVRRELAEAGQAVEESGLQRLRAAWYRFTDANARDNSHLKPTCCSQPPPGTGRQRY